MIFVRTNDPRLFLFCNSDFVCVICLYFLILCILFAGFIWALLKFLEMNSSIEQMIFVIEMESVFLRLKLNTWLRFVLQNIDVVGVTFCEERTFYFIYFNIFQSLLKL